MTGGTGQAGSSVRVRTAMRRVFIGLCAALGAYEGLALWTAADGDTISEVVWAATDDPSYGKVIVLLVGLALGHFFWPRRG